MCNCTSFHRHFIGNFGGHPEYKANTYPKILIWLDKEILWPWKHMFRHKNHLPKWICLEVTSFLQILNYKKAKPLWSPHRPDLGTTIYKLKKNAKKRLKGRITRSSEKIRSCHWTINNVLLRKLVLLLFFHVKIVIKKLHKSRSSCSEFDLSNFV